MSKMKNTKLISINSINTEVFRHEQSWWMQLTWNAKKLKINVWMDEKNDAYVSRYVIKQESKMIIAQFEIKWWVYLYSLYNYFILYILIFSLNEMKYTNWKKKVCPLQIYIKSLLIFY